MDKDMRALVILAVVVMATVLLFVLQSNEKTAPAPHGEEHVVHWSYEPGTGPADWGSMDPAWRLCAEGRAQSPIDLTGAVPAAETGIERRTHRQGDRTTPRSTSAACCSAATRCFSRTRTRSSPP